MTILLTFNLHMIIQLDTFVGAGPGAMRHRRP